MKTDQTPKTCQVHYNQGKSGKLSQPRKPKEPCQGWDCHGWDSGR